jgi:hypothetical protein
LLAQPKFELAWIKKAVRVTVGGGEHRRHELTIAYGVVAYLEMTHDNAGNPLDGVVVSQQR